MNVKKIIFSEVINAINRRYDMNNFRIDVKTIKRINNIEIDNRSRTRLYINALKKLEEQGFIKKEDKIYKIIKRVDKIELESIPNHIKSLTEKKKETIKPLYEIKETNVPLNHFTSIVKNKSRMGDVREIFTCKYCGEPITSRRTTYHVNIAQKTKFPFCNKECKAEWVYMIQRQKNKKTRLK